MRRSSVMRRARAFTLVELLVVIAIIGVLVALLLPAIQAAREASRRAHCINNIRQLGIACQLHVTSYGYLPSAGWGDWWVGCPGLGSGEKQPGNWTYQLLSFIEESARAGVGRGFKCGDPTSRAAMGAMVGTSVSIFYCPSRRAPAPYPWANQGNFNFDPPALAAKSDYAASFGDVRAFDSDVGPKTLEEAPTYKWKHSGPDFVRRAAANFGSLSPTGHTGVIYQRSQIKYNQIEDGLSATYLLGEKNLDPNHYVDGVSSNDDQTMYNGHDRDNLRSTFIWFPGYENKMTPKYIPRPDTPDTEDNDEYEWAFGGPHSGGWVALFCDGSVHFLSYDMDPLLHQHFGNRLDGEATTLP